MSETQKAIAVKAMKAALVELKRFNECLYADGNDAEGLLKQAIKALE